MRTQWWVVGLLALGLLAAGTAQADRLPPSNLPNAKNQLEIKALAGKIDQLIAQHWKEKGAKGTRVADDAEFMRRVYLDLIGRIPRVSEARAFLRDKRSDKRQRLVDKLLESPGYAAHFTHVWRALMIPNNNNDIFQFNPGSFEAWLKDRLKNNIPYDKMVREVMTVNAGGNNGFGRGVGRGMQQPNSQLTPIAFYQANENKPENLAASTSRLFLGVKLECAQCHDHPFAKWSRKQFWENAAFFTDVAPRQPGVEVPATLKIPGTEKVVRPRFLDGAAPKSRDGVSNRKLLADWMTRGDNPYFARAAANRMWAHFFGIGLIDPLEEESDENPPSHPDLLNELSRQFVAHKFDMKFLIRAIVSSRTYQLSSTLTHATQNDDRLFARMPVKGLTAVQLFDSLSMATGYRDATPQNQRGFVGFGQTSPRAEFLTKFANQDKRTETQTSILQALALMNGQFTAEATKIKDSINLAAVIDFPHMNTPEKKIEALYLATLSRKPRPEELSKMVKYVRSGGPKKNSKAALTDVFWVLLNSSEFILNH
jgi:hypothetical protein